MQRRVVDCRHFRRGDCGSCTLIETPYPDQLARKQQAVQAILGLPDTTWLTPEPSDPTGFRNKAKWAAGGAAGAVRLGIAGGSDGHGAHLDACRILHTPLLQAMSPLTEALNATGIQPYDVAQRRGELKYVIATSSPTGQLMIRFVLRTDRHRDQIAALADALRTPLPNLTVASINLHPEHKAVVEGDTEILLTPQVTLPMPVNHVTLHLAPGSFFQTNPAIAAALYRQAAAWADHAQPRTVWDLYCGVGGFALHLAAAGRRVSGVEVAAEAIRSATLSATLSADSSGGSATGSPGSITSAAAPAAPRFITADATTWAMARSAPGLVVVNPPRRGIGAALAGWLNTSSARWVIYSSCNAHTLAADLRRMPWFTVRAARLFDMFPHTTHHEVMVLLERTVTPGPGRRRRAAAQTRLRAASSTR